MPVYAGGTYMLAVFASRHHTDAISPYCPRRHEIRFPMQDR